MKKMMFLSKNWYFSVQKALIYYTVNKSHHNSFILLVFSHVANFRYVANFRFLTLHTSLDLHRAFTSFVALKFTWKCLDNFKLKIAVFIFTGAPFYITAFFHPFFNYGHVLLIIDTNLLKDYKIKKVPHLT